MRAFPCAVGAIAGFMVSCASVTVIGGVKVHGDLHGLSASDIQDAITASQSSHDSPKWSVTDVRVLTPIEIHLYSGDYSSDYANYIIMLRLRGKWVYYGRTITLS